jgi:DNA-binding transcriptional LysR family regulator
MRARIADLGGTVLAGSPTDFGKLIVDETENDCVLSQIQTWRPEEAADDLTVQILYDDEVVVAAGAHSKWVRRRKIDLAELIDEAWVLTGPTSRARTWGEEVFRAQGLSRPKPIITTDSIILRARLVDGGPYLAMFASSALRRLIADHYAITALSVDLRAIALSVGIATLKNQTLSPVVERVLACVREVAASLAGKQRAGRLRLSKSKVS